MVETLQPLERPQSPAYGLASHIYITVVHLVSANTEYLWQVPIGTKWIKLHSRDGTAIRMATERDVVATPSSDKYYTVIAADTDAFAGGEVDIGGMDIQDTNQFLYFASGTANKFVEIIVGV